MENKVSDVERCIVQGGSHKLPQGCTVTFWVAIAIFMFLTFCSGLRNCAMLTVY